MIDPPVCTSVENILDLADAIGERGQYGGLVNRLRRCADEENPERAIARANRIIDSMWEWITHRQKVMTMTAFVRRRLER